MLDADARFVDIRSGVEVNRNLSISLRFYQIPTFLANLLLIYCKSAYCRVESASVSPLNFGILISKEAVGGRQSAKT